MKKQELKTEFIRLVEIMETLRGPGGCSWDKEQDYYSLIPYIIEEAYEVVETLQNKDLDSLQLELGDLLLQVIFQAQIGREKGDFDLVDVLSGISEKLIRRHPHVFADTEVENVDEIISNWEKIKDSEKENNCEEKNLLLGDISQANPALIQSFEVQEKAAEVGFDWDNIYGVLDKIEEEIDEVREAIKEKKENHLKEEIGDLLFSIVNLARFEGINPEQALLFSLNKFKNRFKYMENSLTKEGSCFEEQSLELLEEYWERAKKEMEGKN